MSSTTVVETKENIPLGGSVPAFTPHAISVSLPTWKDNVGYEEGEKRVVDSMVSGYPRFFIHLKIQKLMRICEAKFGTPSEGCMLFSTRQIADECRQFMISHESPSPIRLVQFTICPEDQQTDTPSSVDLTTSTSMTLHIALFPKEAFPIAKQFWQHAGLGISSRFAERCLSMLPDAPSGDARHPPSPTNSRFPFKARNRHYAKREQPVTPSPPPEDTDRDVYLEERYGRNMPLSYACHAKRAMRRRIAGTLVRDVTDDDCAGGLPCAGGADVEIGPSSRGVLTLTEDDVFLYPTGMSAIWSAHKLARETLPLAKSVCFGFSYTDTLKILQKWGPGAHFFGTGSDSELDELEAILEKEPVLAVFTEIPSNPLLRSVNLPKLKKLADKYGFLLVVDDTIGTFANVDVLPFADVVVSSLSKIFSGDANVMGGSLVLNPQGGYYPKLKAHMAASFEDVYFDEDAVYMERNSRNFHQRIVAVDENTQAVCHFLHSRSLAASESPDSSEFVIKRVYYPKYEALEAYDLCRVPNGGYGALFSLAFTSLLASEAFFDALECPKGPSLGTNFTLACPYTILAHFTELDWAAEYGVEEGLVRISVGLEDRTELLGMMERALKAAEKAIKSAAAST